MGGWWVGVRGITLAGGDYTVCLRIIVESESGK